MARTYEPTQENLAAWEEFVAGLPEHLKETARKLPPWVLFRLRTTGQRVYTRSIHDNGTVRVAVSGEFNLLTFERDVVGVSPADLEECDLPAPDEQVGVVHAFKESEPSC